MEPPDLPLSLEPTRVDTLLEAVRWTAGGGGGGGGGLTQVGVSNDAIVNGTTVPLSFVQKEVN